MLCRECGSQIPDDAKECEFCGAKVDASADNGETKVIDSEELAAAAAAAGAGEASEEIFDENEKKRREQMEKMMEDKKKQLSEIEQRRNEKRKKQRRKKIAIIALICLLAAGAAAWGAHYLLQNNSNQGAAEQTIPAASPTPAPDVLPSESPSASPEISMSPQPAEQSASPSPAQSPAAASGSASASGTTGTTAPASASGASQTKSGGSTSSSSSANSGNSSSAKSSGSSSSKSSSSARTSSGSSGGSSASDTAYKNAPDSGIVTDKISSRLVTGGEVIHNTQTGKYLMTFVMGGTKYYANVSEGSTTEQIKGKSYTINADATPETYNGNTIYEISSMTKYEGSYILPDSGTRLLTQSDLSGLSKYDLALARNEIYARHGRKFQTPEYSTYFGGKSWYQINPNYNYSDEDTNLNEIEKKNVQLILGAEKR